MLADKQFIVQKVIFDMENLGSSFFKVAHFVSTDSVQKLFLGSLKNPGILALNPGVLSHVRPKI
jgi:hypothetical protein